MSQIGRMNLGKDASTFKYYTMCGLQEGFEPFAVNMKREITMWFSKRLPTFVNIQQDHAHIEVRRPQAGVGKGEEFRCPDAWCLFSDWSGDADRRNRRQPALPQGHPQDIRYPEQQQRHAVLSAERARGVLLRRQASGRIAPIQVRTGSAGCIAACSGFKCPPAPLLSLQLPSQRRRKR